MSYDTVYKNSVLGAVGYYADDAKNMNSKIVNGGWMKRNEWFFVKINEPPPSDELETERERKSRGRGREKEREDSDDEFQVITDDPIRRTYWFRPKNCSKLLQGYLYTPFFQSTCPIPYGVAIDIRMNINKKDFLLIQAEDDDNTYTIAISEISLFVPRGTMNHNQYQDLGSRWTLQNRVNIHYRRYQVVKLALPKESQHHQAWVVKSGFSLPSRIVITLLRNKDAMSKIQNPFNFTRMFKGDQQLRTVWITDCNITLNGENIDYIEDQMSEEDAMSMFVRMQDTCGFLQSNTCNSITYEDFKEGYFFMCYDLTTGKNAYDSSFTPVPRVGPLEVNFTFNNPVPEEIHAICLQEYPATITVLPTGQVGSSF